MIDGAARGALAACVSAGRLLTDPPQLSAYASDALTAFRAVPGAVVLAETADEVARVVQTCARYRLPFVPRGSGTSLSGGSLPVEGGVVIALNRMNRIVRLDPVERIAVCEPGVINLEISRAAAAHGLYYAPDPSSQPVCTIGGNVAFNSGGAHCLKYGFTVHHVLAVEAVTPDGALVHLGGPSLDSPGLDLAGVLVGSEGTLAIVTRVTLRILRRPESVRTVLAAFDAIDVAGAAVSDIIAAGIIPAAVEMMDRLTIEAAEAAVHPNFPDANAILIVELDGPKAEVDELFPQVEAICRQRGASVLQVAENDDQRAQFWKGRKAAFAAMGRVSPNYYVQDGVVPRTRLPEVLARIRALETRSGLRIGNVFHAGDGNLHPLICYDERIPGQAQLAEDVAGEILAYCIEAGGSLTGEHGIGADKSVHMPKMFTADDLDTMQLVRCAFDPADLCNPGKVFPTPRLCGEVPGPYRQHPLEQAGVAERF
jgi:glycolate oxidase